MRVLTYEQAAKDYNLPEETFREAVNTGELPAIKKGNSLVRLLDEAIEKWLRGQSKTR